MLRIILPVDSDGLCGVGGGDAESATAPRPHGGQVVVVANVNWSTGIGVAAMQLLVTWHGDRIGLGWPGWVLR